MKRLIIDDVRTFVAPSPQDTTIYARTTREADAILFADDFDFDEVWWDYDMGKSGTTSRLAREVGESREYMPLAKCVHIIHSANPIGREALDAALRLLRPVHASPFMHFSGGWS